MYKKLKYRHKIALIIFLFSLIPIVIIGSVLFSKLWNGKVEENLAQNNDQFTSSVTSIDNLLLSYIGKVYFINNNYYIFNYLESGSDTDLVGVLSFNEYLDSVMEAIKADNVLMDITIYTLNDFRYVGSYIRDGRAIEDEGEGEGIIDEILAHGENTIIWKIRRYKRPSSSEYADYLCIYKEMTTIGKPLAIIEIRVPFSMLGEHFSDSVPDGSIIVCEMADGSTTKIITSGYEDPSSAQDILENTTQQEIQSQYFVTSIDLKSGVGTLSMYTPKNQIMGGLKSYFTMVVILLICIVVVLFVVVEIVAFSLTKKLEGLFVKINKNVENLIENEGAEIHVSDDEFGTIENKFHELILRIKEYYIEMNQYELEKKSLETKLLQERINPHFLYNTLSTIKWVSEEKRIHDVVDSMVKYYRIALNQGSSIITIHQELEMTREYLKLQKFAYGNEFDFTIGIEEGVERHLMLKNLLQPIVENAVLHGLSGMETGGTIEISVKRQRDDIVFEVSDNGAGMDVASIENILHGASVGAGGGYGIRNIQRRIETFYGEGYGISMESTVGQGTTVSIMIPAES